MNLKQFFSSKFNRGVLWNLASVVILGVGGILINLLIVSIRGEEVLGSFNQIYSIFMFVSQIGVGGIQFSVLKQISYHQDDMELCADITSSGLVLSSIFLLCSCLILWLLAKPIGNLLQSPDVELGIIYILPGLFFIGLNRLLNNTMNGLALMRDYAISQSARFILIPFFVFLLALSPVENAALVWSFSVTEIILFIFLWRYVYGKLIPLRPIKSAKQRFAEHLSYGGRGFLSGVLSTLNTRIDVLLLGYFASDKIVGIYSLASTFADGFNKLGAAVRWNIDPVLGQYFAQNDRQGIQRLASRSRRTIYPLTALLGVAAVLFYPLILFIFIPSPSLTVSWLCFFIIMIGVVINSNYRVFKGILLQGNKPEIYTFFIFLTIVFNIVSNILLIPAFGLVGAALATLLTYLAESAIMFYLVWRQWQIII